MSAYAELQVTTNFSFLRGASHPDEFVRRAGELGHGAIAVTDRNSLAGVVRAHAAAKEAGVPLVVGCRIVLEDPRGLSVLVYPTDRPAYARLCRLLTLGKRRAEKGACLLTLEDLLAHSEGMLGVALPPGAPDDRFVAHLGALRRGFAEDGLSLAASRTYAQGDEARTIALARLSAEACVPLVAVNDARHHAPERRALHDTLCCIRHGCTIEQAGLRLLANAERHLKPPSEMHRLFARFPGALGRTVEIADRCRGFSLDQLRYEYPDEVVPPGSTPMGHLRALTEAGALRRYPGGVPEKVRGQIRHELGLIDELRYAAYFLTVHDIVAFAQSRGILCQGRGAAANSAVCYCLGVTAVDPERVSVLFERFVSRERDEPPDIDIDFEHERREEVIQHLYAKYGRDRAALTAEVITYRGRSAIREVGKAMGLSLDCVDRLAKEVEGWGSGPPRPERLRQAGLDPHDPHIRRILGLAAEIEGFPRHLSQHVGGFVITRTPLCELVPIENARMEDRTVIEWDKDDIDALGMLKVDVLGLGMLTCVRKAMDLVRAHEGRDLTLATIPPEDPAVYDMICKADTVGVFQIESRAQMSMLPRLRPRCYYDLVIEVAIVRPGPIQGDMVHPYLRRREGKEPVLFPSAELEAVLGRTLGVPLFQEQMLEMAMVLASFSGDEAEELRRAMSFHRSEERMRRAEMKLRAAMDRAGVQATVSDRIVKAVSSFALYGFPESHAISFAHLAYASAYLKTHRAPEFYCALMNNQPMGFYSPATLVRDAKRHGVPVRPVCIVRSQWWTRIESDGALRLGLRQVQGLNRGRVEGLIAERQQRAFASMDELRRRTKLSKDELRTLAEIGALNVLSEHRRAALWEAERTVRAGDLFSPIFTAV